MSGETNRLLALAHEVSQGARRARDGRHRRHRRAGERRAHGAWPSRPRAGKARSLLGHQVKILTDDAFTKARIKTIEGSKIFETVDRGEIAVVAGFQGVDEDGNITTLGRGGSDTSAVAVAAAIGADECEIYTDVDGVYTTDPNVCPIGAEDRPHLVRGDARARVARRQGAADPQRRDRHEVRRPGARPKLVQRHAGDHRDQGRRSARRRRRQRRRLRQGRGARARRRASTTSPGVAAELFETHRREEHLGRHDRPERDDRRRPARDASRSRSPKTDLARGQAVDRGDRARASARARCATTRTS